VIDERRFSDSKSIWGYGKGDSEGQLITTRYLINEGKSMVVAFTLKLKAEPNNTFARQIWNKQT